jgi:hypothetical protein
MSAARPPQRTRFRPERMLPVACIVAAAALLASELTTTFHFVPTGGEAECSQQAADRHSLALGVIALFAIGAVVVAVMGASRPAAISVAIAGLAALAMFLIVDLPDANSTGTLGEACAQLPYSLEAKAEPQAGFWLELAGALALTFCGALLATLTPAQLAGLRPRRGGTEERD